MLSTFAVEASESSAAMMRAVVTKIREAFTMSFGMVFVTGSSTEGIRTGEMFWLKTEKIG